MTGPTSHSLISQRLRLHYVDWGNHQAPPLVMVHGGRDHCRNWDWVAKALADDYHVIALDLRGHGDSQWVSGGSYAFSDFVYDLAQLIHQTKLAPVTLMAHSYGGSIALRYAGLYPDKVSKIIAIEGLGPSPEMLKQMTQKPVQERFVSWIDQVRGLSARLPRRYPKVDDAIARMQEENPHLTPEQARHLTVHGVNQNEDGTFSWKFDNYFRVMPPNGFSASETQSLYGNINCPTLLLRGTQSWASDPLIDGRAKYFNNAEVINVDNAGHWVHHDQLTVYLKHVNTFLAA